MPSDGLHECRPRIRKWRLNSFMSTVQVQKSWSSQMCNTHVSHSLPPRPPVFNVDLEFFPKRMTKKKTSAINIEVRGDGGEVLYRLRRAAAPLQWQSTPAISTFDGIYACFSHQTSCRDDRGSYSSFTLHVDRSRIAKALASILTTCPFPARA